jgi:Flp pilus assembly protein TadD
VAASPDPDALAQLAFQDLQNNRPADAEANCLRALSVNRQHSRALTLLGMILHSQVRHEEAVRVFNALTLQEPENAEHWSNLGAALRSTGRFGAALEACGRAAQLGTASPGLLYNIGLLQSDRCDFQAAYTTLTQAVALAPNDAGIRCVFAQCCYDLSRFDEALAALENWPTLRGLTSDAVAQIAYLLVTLGEPRRAEPALRRLTESSQRGERASLMLVRVLERVNRLPAAREAMTQLKASQGTSGADPDVLLAEAVLAARAGAHEEACRLLALALQDHSDFLRRHQLLFPLAKSLDALRRYEEAYTALIEAHRSQVAFLQAATGKTAAEKSPTMALARDGCDPKDIALWDDTNSPGTADSPIFIVAFPRSGTTLLEQTLDAHPSLKSMDEQAFLKKALDDVTDYGIRYPVELGKLTDAQLQSVRERYWQRVRLKVELLPGQRLVDKNPLNLLRLPLICRLFPNAPIMLAIRHPCDTVLSCFLQHFRAPDLALMCQDLLTLANHYSHAFDFWNAQLPLLRAATYTLRYETLVTDFPAQVRKLSEFLRLPWDDAMLAPGEHARAKGFISTPSYAQVIQPVNEKSVGRWQGYAVHFKDILPILMPFIERWGYSV